MDCEIASLVHAKIFDVDVAAQAGVEEQIPAGMVIVVVNVDAIAIPLPIAAVIEIVGRDDPGGIVVKNDTPGAIVNAASDKDFAYVAVPAVRIGAAGADASFVVIPVAVMRIVGIIPALVLAVVVAVVAIFVLVPVLVLAIVVAVASSCFSPR